MSTTYTETYTKLPEQRRRQRRAERKHLSDAWDELANSSSLSLRGVRSLEQPISSSSSVQVARGFNPDPTLFRRSAPDTVFASTSSQIRSRHSDKARDGLTASAASASGTSRPPSLLSLDSRIPRPTKPASPRSERFRQVKATPPSLTRDQDQELNEKQDVIEASQDPFADQHAVVPESKEADHELEALEQERKAEFPDFPDYVPISQSRVTAGRWGLICAIVSLNLALVAIFILAPTAKASFGMIITLKSRDIISVLWQSLLWILSQIARPFRKKKEAVVHPPRKIVSLVPVYKESTQDVLDTVDSIITDNKVRPQDFNIICIIADGFDVEDDVIVERSVHRVDESPYFSWKIRESAFRLHFGFRMGTPIMIVRKVKNAGKKDSLIFAFDLFNSDNEATGHCNSEARALVLDHIRKLYNQPELQSFDFVFCTDADTKILAGSINALAERLDNEGKETVGACGIVEADFFKPDRSWRTCGAWYFWDHYQGFQYTFGQWVRRRSESSWGRVTCMPGAITMLRTGSILGQASAEYRKHVLNGNLIFRQVQYQGTDRRLCWSIISRSKNVRTVLETKAACFTIPPQSLSHYLSQRRRWGSNAYFNAIVTLTMPNQKLITRIWMILEIARSTLVFFRIYNFGHFVYNLVTKFDLMAIIPLLLVTLLPQIWFFCFVVLGNKRYRQQVHHLLYGQLVNRLFSIFLTPTVYANVLLGFGDFRWGKSHTGANAAAQAAAAAVANPDAAMEEGRSRRNSGDGSERGDIL